MKPRFVEYFDGAAGDASRLGGKGSSLCRLVQRGYRVPAGFVIPIDAFERTCSALGLSESVDAVNAALSVGGDVALAGRPIGPRLREAPIPGEVLAPVLEAVDCLGLWRNNAHGIIVRSSATVEDSATHSFAGIFDSLPIAAPDQLERAIREVWSSVFSLRALTYFREVGLRHAPGMAVVVQRFLEAERSGVMFTRFAGRTLVEHVEGGCEKLVKGEVTPDRLWIPGPGQVPGDSGPLDPRHALDLSGLAATLEEAFGAPQDVEWVLCDGNIHVVQSRPITASAAPTSDGPEQIDTGDVQPVLTGTPASGGWGSGPVHLVFNIEQALTLEAGRVLVTPMTNPDMVVAMRKAAAIVTDVGGMICHAAIVSRELGLPCVVGTASATVTLKADEMITAAGTMGAVFRGIPSFAARAATLRAGDWADLWALWARLAADRRELIPVISCADALETIPIGMAGVVLVPDLDLRCGPTGLWADLEGMTTAQANGVLDDYFAKVARLARARSVESVYVLPGAHAAAFEGLIAETVRRRGSPLALHASGSDAAKSDPQTGGLPGGQTALALGAAALHGAAAGTAITGMAEAEAAALDTIKFFGHRPGSSEGAMPDAARRRAWWRLLPEYGRYHDQFSSAAERGNHTWLEVRPELVISALLKSLVQPGFEMVPRVLGFADVPPMHIKWIKCRYHFRADSFARVWQAIVRSTWSAEFMADLMRRVRASYGQLAEVLVLFPTSDAELRAITPEKMVALITSWWPRWVEFFALCWFIQAQGDDILYPFIEETVNDGLERVSRKSDGFAWPGPADFVAPTTAVMSGDYMSSMGRLHEALLGAGLSTREVALATLERGEHPDISEQLAAHLENWHWMRDRDLLFEPWDHPAKVIDTALKTQPHKPADYDANLRRNRFALSLHFDLALAPGRADGLVLATRFLHDLNVERENHHILWLKYSYPVRKLILEIERRLVAGGSLGPGDVFFMQAPELIEATRGLPAALTPNLIAAVKNRRRGYLYEARLEQVDPAGITREDDYY